MSSFPRQIIILFFVAIAVIALSGCAAKTRHYSNSVVHYLYPDQSEPVETPLVPTLTLPLRVGMAVVPESSGQFSMRHNQSFTEKEKNRLLHEIASRFKQYDFVRSFEILPSVYLRPGGSFENLDQIRRLYGIDIMVLVSYDQTQFTDEGLASITYWTLIGAYIVPGEKNDTHTLIDAVVYDIDSRKMLFRAPGISHIKGHATPVNLSEELRTDSLQGFQLAGNDLVGNLDEQLQRFKQRVKEQPRDYQIVRRPGYTGAGGIDTDFLLLATLLFPGFARALGRAA